MVVATGDYSVAELQQHRPDYCFTDLGHIPAVLQVLTHEAAGKAQYVPLESAPEGSMASGQ